MPPAARIASSAPCRSNPGSVPVTTIVLPVERSAGRCGRAWLRQLGLDAGVGQVLEHARPGAAIAELRRPGWQRRWARRRAPPRTARVTRWRRRAEQRARPREERLVARRAPRPASQRARSIAVVQPTCGMPSELRTRSSGRRRERWIASYRFSALLRANRSSAYEVVDGQPVEVAAALSPGRAGAVARAPSSRRPRCPSRRGPRSGCTPARPGPGRTGWGSSGGPRPRRGRRPCRRRGTGRASRTRARRRSAARSAAGRPRGSRRRPSGARPSRRSGCPCGAPRRGCGAWPARRSSPRP